MITKRQKILLIEDEIFNSCCEFFNKFEGLEIINSSSEIKEIWSINKTPVMQEKNFQEKDNIPFIKIPYNLIGNDKIQEFTKFCYKQGFEPGEYISGKTYNTRMERCFLCEISNYKGCNNLEEYNQFIERPVDMIIYESPNFFVIPELGALKQGFLMIVPKEHYLSMAQCPEYLLTEYGGVCKDIEEVLINTFNAKVVSFFEHGSGPSGISSHKKSIVHAHVHVVIDFILKQKYQKMVQLQSYNDITSASQTHYFSYQESSKGQLMICKDPKVYVQRQFARQIIADELGYAPGQYNWRNAEFLENANATVFYLYRYIKTLKSGRIYERTKGFINGFEKREDIGNVGI